jgi:hypothetical protein
MAVADPQSVQTQTNHPLCVIFDEIPASMQQGKSEFAVTKTAPLPLNAPSQSPGGKTTKQAHAEFAKKPRISASTTS